MTLRNAITSWSQQSGARAFDVEFADWLSRRSGLSQRGGDISEMLWFAIWALSFQAAQGHVCIDLGRPLNIAMLPDNVRAQLPSSQELLQLLRTSALVGAPDDRTPLVLLSERTLYLRRFFALENRLASTIAARIRPIDQQSGAPRERIADVIARLFADRTAPDWQQVACVNAILNRFSIIAGGPGTGKTTTVVRLLAALCEIENLDASDIRLVAPTGKAAMRLSQSVRDNRDRLYARTGLGNTVNDAASTLHRLLRFSRRSQTFYFNRSNPLPVRVVVVDEASMVDVSMMMALFDAIPVDARVILLGDQYQLASVEEGSVLAELCGDLSQHGYSVQHRQRLNDIVALPADAATGKSQGVLDDCITVLRRSFRFGDDTPLGRLAQAINAGDSDHALALLTAGANAEAVLTLRWQDSIAALQRDIIDLAVEQAMQIIAAHSTDAAFAAFHRARLLCATREGPLGVETINHLVIARVNQRMHWQRRRIFAGLPILILENDYENDLFNGDTGLIVEQEGQLVAAFETGVDHSAAPTFRYLALSRLPQWETAFAMTIHKSQGSEFDSVVLVYPPASLPLLTRELLYTGITRSRERVTVFAQESVLRRSLQTIGVRQSGLSQLLAGLV